MAGGVGPFGEVPLPLKPQSTKPSINSIKSSIKFN